MEIRKIQPMRVLCFETETTMKEMFQYVRVVANNIYKDAIKHELEIAGPVYWIYIGADGRQDTRFALTIAVPVSGMAPEAGASVFTLKQLDPFNCVHQTHFGDWSKLGRTYRQLFDEVKLNNLSLSGQNREIYLNMDFENMEGNITEVQIGILA